MTLTLDYLIQFLDWKCLWSCTKLNSVYSWENIFPENKMTTLEHYCSIIEINTTSLHLFARLMDSVNVSGYLKKNLCGFITVPMLQLNFIFKSIQVSSVFLNFPWDMGTSKTTRVPFLKQRLWSYHLTCVCDVGNWSLDDRQTCRMSDGSQSQLPRADGSFRMWCPTTKPETGVLN